MKLQSALIEESVEEATVIRNKLLEFNARKSGGLDWLPLQVFLKDDQEEVRGGILAWTVWNWMHIDSLWVDEDLRGTGWGSRILQAGEAEACTRGCTVCEVDTFNFQARGFYEKSGYEVFGTLQGLAGGRIERIYLRKTLTPVSQQPLKMTRGATS